MRAWLRRGATALCCVLLGSGALWGAGFEAFNEAARRAAPPPPTSDGIVVLTGGADRVDAALRLLAEGRAPLLLVSGVGHGAEWPSLVRGIDVPLGPEMEARVTLGREAATTVGNAAETASWAQQHGMRSLIVVTAGYHMPRALLELRAALPGVALHPAPVQPQAVRGGLALGTVRLLATEYDKLLAVRLGLGRRLMEVWGS